MWYGTIGWARTEQYFLSPLVTNEPVGTAGMSIGLGVDALLTDRVFVGLEYQQRRLDIEEGEMGGFPSVSYKNTVDSVALRVGLTF